MPMPQQMMQQNQQMPPGPGGGMPSGPAAGGAPPAQQMPQSPSDDGPDQSFAMLIQSRMESLGPQMIAQFEQSLLGVPDQSLLQLIANVIPELGIAFTNIGNGSGQPQAQDGAEGSDNPLIKDQDDENQLPVPGGGQSRLAAQYPGQ